MHRVSPSSTAGSPGPGGSVLRTGSFGQAKNTSRPRPTPPQAGKTPDAPGPDARGLPGWIEMTRLRTGGAFQRAPASPLANDEELRVACRQLHRILEHAARLGRGREMPPPLRPLLSDPRLARIEAEFEALYGTPLRARLAKVLSAPALREAVRRLDTSRAAAQGGRVRANVMKVLDLRAARPDFLSEVAVEHEFVGGNRVEALADRDVAARGLFPAIAAAKSSIHILMLEFRDGVLGRALADLLIEKRRQGVEVRMVISAHSSKQYEGSRHRSLVDRMIENGIEIVRQERLMEDHEHDKLVIVDSAVALLGGWTVRDECIASRAFAESVRPDTPRDAWGLPIPPPGDRPAIHDMMIKIEGPAAKDLQVDFLVTWLHHQRALHPRWSDEQVLRKYFPDQQVDPDGVAVKAVKSFSWEPNSVHRELLQVIESAHESLDVEFTYLSSSDVIEQLKRKARAGVRVRLLVPHDGAFEGLSDALAYQGLRQSYDDLIAAGVQVFEFPGYNHGKVVLADEERAWFSSGNPDFLFSGAPDGGIASDVGAVVEDREFVGQVRRTFLCDDFGRLGKRIPPSSFWRKLSPSVLLGALVSAVTGGYEMNRGRLTQAEWEAVRAAAREYPCRAAEARAVARARADGQPEPLASIPGWPSLQVGASGAPDVAPPIGRATLPADPARPRLPRGPALVRARSAPALRARAAGEAVSPSRLGRGASTSLDVDPAPPGERRAGRQTRCATGLDRARPSCRRS